MDVNTGEHYAIYSDRIQKMSVTPKLYLAWGYRQLLQTIQSDALQFGVNSPQPSTSGVSQRVQPTSSSTISCDSVHAATSFPVQTHHCQV